MPVFPPTKYPGTSAFFPVPCVTSNRNIRRKRSETFSDKTRCPVVSVVCNIISFGKVEERCVTEETFEGTDCESDCKLEGTF